MGSRSLRSRCSSISTSNLVSGAGDEGGDSEDDEDEIGEAGSVAWGGIGIHSSDGGEVLMEFEFAVVGKEDGTGLDQPK